MSQIDYRSENKNVVLDYNNLTVVGPSTFNGAVTLPGSSGAGAVSHVYNSLASGGTGLVGYGSPNTSDVYINKLGAGYGITFGNSLAGLTTISNTYPFAFGSQSVTAVATTTTNAFVSIAPNNTLVYNSFPSGYIISGSSGITCTVGGIYAFQASLTYVTPPSNNSMYALAVGINRSSSFIPLAYEYNSKNSPTVPMSGLTKSVVTPVNVGDILQFWVQSSEANTFQYLLSVLKMSD